jgi:hypothetical protein
VTGADGNNREAHPAPVGRPAHPNSRARERCQLTDFCPVAACDVQLPVRRIDHLLTIRGPGRRTDLGTKTTQPPCGAPQQRRCPKLTRRLVSKPLHSSHSLRSGETSTSWAFLTGRGRAIDSPPSTDTWPASPPPGPELKNTREPSVSRGQPFGRPSLVIRTVAVRHAGLGDWWHHGEHSIPLRPRIAARSPMRAHDCGGGDSAFVKGCPAVPCPRASNRRVLPRRAAGHRRPSLVASFAAGVTAPSSPPSAALRPRVAANSSNEHRIVRRRRRAGADAKRSSSPPG